jgi:uncharacterized protein DUF3313
MRKFIRLIFAGAFLSLTLVGCRASPAPSAGFADPKLLKHDPAVPLNKFWRQSNIDWKRYDKIYVAKVSTSQMLKVSAWEKGECVGKYDKDIRELAVYQRTSIINAFRKDPHHRFQVLDHPTHDPHALVLEVALVQVVPSKVLLNLAEEAPFYVGEGIEVVRFVIDDKSCAAYEARIRDARTGKVLALAADREDEQLAIVDIRRLSWYGDVHGIMNDWSKQFVEIANNEPGQKVEASATFRVLPS